MRLPNFCTHARHSVAFAIASGDMPELFDAFGKKPYCAAEKLAVRICRAANFLACHRVAGQESGLVRLVVMTRSTFAGNTLYAADIGYKLMRLQNRSKLLQPFENAEDWTAKQYQVAFDGRRVRILSDYVDGCAAQRDGGLGVIAVPSDNRSIKGVLAQRHSH